MGNIQVMFPTFRIKFPSCFLWKASPFVRSSSSSMAKCSSIEAAAAAPPPVHKRCAEWPEHYSSPTIKLWHKIRKHFLRDGGLSFKRLETLKVLWVLKIRPDSGNHGFLASLFSLHFVGDILRSRNRAFFGEAWRMMRRLWPTLVPIFLLSPDRKNDDGNGKAPPVIWKNCQVGMNFSVMPAFSFSRWILISFWHGFTSIFIQLTGIKCRDFFTPS